MFLKRQVSNQLFQPTILGLQLLKTFGLINAKPAILIAPPIIALVGCAVYLLNRGIPIILQTGMSIPPELAARFPDLVVRAKPNRTDQLVAELASMITMHGKPTNSA